MSTFAQQAYSGAAELGRVESYGSLIASVLIGVVGIVIGVMMWKSKPSNILVNGQPSQNKYTGKEMGAVAFLISGLIIAGGVYKVYASKTSKVYASAQGAESLLGAARNIL